MIGIVVESPYSTQDFIKIRWIFGNGNLAVDSWVTQVGVSREQLRNLKVLSNDNK